jgi:hypothetical protein
MENCPFIDEFPIKTAIYKGFSMAMLNNQMVDTCRYKDRKTGQIDPWMERNAYACMPPYIRTYRQTARQAGRHIKYNIV